MNTNDLVLSTGSSASPVLFLSPGDCHEQELKNDKLSAESPTDQPNKPAELQAGAMRLQPAPGPRGHSATQQHPGTWASVTASTPTSWPSALHDTYRWRPILIAPSNGLSADKAARPGGDTAAARSGPRVHSSPGSLVLGSGRGGRLWAAGLQPRAQERLRSSWLPTIILL